MSTRYLIKAQLANGTEYYRYNPPSKYIEGGIVTRCNLGECFGTATQKAKQFNVKIDEFDAKQKELDEGITDGENISDVLIADEILVGWDGVTDGDKEIIYSKATKKEVLEFPMLANTLVDVYFNQIAKQKTKN